MKRAQRKANTAALNLTPEHFSRLLHELAAEGLAQVNGRHIAGPDPQRVAGQARAG